MTNRKALIALRDAVVAGTVRHGDFHCLGVSMQDNARAAYKGSVDAAIALLEAVLPGAPFWVETKIDGIHHAGVFIPNLGRTFQAEAINLARALLIATLNAMIANSERG